MLLVLKLSFELLRFTDFSLNFLGSGMACFDNRSSLMFFGDSDTVWGWKLMDYDLKFASNDLAAFFDREEDRWGWYELMLLLGSWNVKVFFFSTGGFSDFFKPFTTSFFPAMLKLIMLEGTINFLGSDL